MSNASQPKVTGWGARNGRSAAPAPNGAMAVSRLPETVAYSDAQ